ncbi:MAG: polymorphic toxin-type HINT domain-containing protein [Actinomadura sp.]
MIGFVPVVGDAADLVNAAWSGIECGVGYGGSSSCIDAGIALAAAIPFVGWGAGAAKIGKGGKRIYDLARGADEAAAAVPPVRPRAGGGSNTPGGGGRPRNPSGGSTGSPGGGTGGAPKSPPPAKPKPPPPAPPPSRGPSCPNSFVAGTLVLMADGSRKPIEQVQAGDAVLAADPETGDTRGRTVLDTITGEGDKRLVQITVDTDGAKGAKSDAITATDGHPFWIPDLGTWLDAGQLRPGMWRGYYDPNSMVFIAKTVDGNINTVMTNVAKAYINRLRGGRADHGGRQSYVRSEGECSVRLLH